MFICTADPSKEPALNVMNTVISAMALDYPADKLNVYLSDDGGAPATLYGLKEAWSFALSWIPFVRKYGINNRCPMAYFEREEDSDDDHKREGGKGVLQGQFIKDKKKIKDKYEAFQKRLLRASEDKDAKGNARDHPSLFQVIGRDAVDDNLHEEGYAQMMPLLVYIAREKTPTRPHHFKAGALNVLLRISGVMSNSPYVLVLDCDMYCNDSMSARQAMCFHLDPKLSTSLAFVQYPQRFHNSNDNNIYDNRITFADKIVWRGPDGLQGPILCGTGFYMKRKALYGTSLMEGVDIKDLRNYFGTSNEFLKYLHHQHYGHERAISIHKQLPCTFLQEIKFLASSAYDDNTKWGHEVGFMYYSVAEDVLTGFLLHCKGWISVFYNPPTPQFLGSTPTNLNDSLIQHTRWTTGLEEIGFGKYCPIIYAPLQGMSLLQTMCYGYVTLFSLYTLPLWCLTTIPQLCLLNDIPLYPRLHSPFFIVFPFVFISSLSRHSFEVFTTCGSVTSFLNDQRMWMIKSLVPYFYGTIEAIMKCIGVRETSFVPTNKVVDEEQAEMFRLGIYDFRTTNMFLVPIVAAVVINLVGFVGGIVRMLFGVMKLEEMVLQVLLSGLIFFLNFPVIDGMLFRKDNGRVRFPVTLISAACAFGFLALGSLMFFR